MRFPLTRADLVDLAALEAFVDRAPVVIRHQLTLDLPPDAVWPAFADDAAWVEWWADMRSCRYTSEPPVGVGSTRTVGVAALRVDEEIVAFEPGHRYAFVIVAANVPFLQTMVEDVRLEDADGDRTTITYTQAVALAPWAAWMRRPFERRLRTALADGLAGLPTWLAARS